MFQRVKKFMKRFVPASRHQLGELNIKLSKVEKLLKNIEKNAAVEQRLDELSSKLNKAEKSFKDASITLSNFRRFERNFLRASLQPRLLNITLHILEHCNLNCKGCNTFSPIADKAFVPHETIHNDLIRLSVITNGRLQFINVVGGEPLLHPELNEILASARASFPVSEIMVITNGLLLLQQGNDFWSTCKINSIKLRVTKYPIDLDYSQLYEAAKIKHVDLSYFCTTGEVTKTLYKSPMDPLGLQDPVRSFWGCHYSNKCEVLLDGRIYPCSFIPCSQHLNKKFGTKMEIEEGDYFDIYKNGNISELLEFLCKPKPFCRYCKITEREKGFAWEPSKREMSEWV